MNTKRNRRLLQHNRRGVMTPLVACSLLVVMGAMALVLDRLWLDAARLELTTSAEAAALAAARALVSDDLLRSDPRPEERIADARRVAAAVAGRNLVAGRPVVLDAKPGGDVRFGRRVRHAESGILRFLETESAPTSVRVRALRTRNRNNPVALFFAQLTGQPTGDVAASVEAGLNNRVVGLRPSRGVPVPALPLAILKRAPTGIRSDTWEKQITERTGEDRYSYDAENGRVVAEPDGIPEIVLTSLRTGGRADEANVRLLRLGNGLERDRVFVQIQRGWTAEDLDEFGGELLLNGPPVVVNSGAVFGNAVRSSLEEVVGHCRICLLYDDSPTEPRRAAPHAGATRPGSVHCDAFVAGRVMSVEAIDGDACRIVFQPAVLTTRTAVLADSEADAPQARDVSNPYIYKLQLTR